MQIYFVSDCTNENQFHRYNEFKSIISMKDLWDAKRAYRFNLYQNYTFKLVVKLLSHY